jgi:molybdopterin converting factor small subunit
MVTWINVHGTLQNYFPENHFSIDLPDGARVKDLFRIIEERYGLHLPEHLWNREMHRFRGSVLVIIDHVDVHDEFKMLENGQEIALITPVHGG